jgi:hypothetical protein
MGFPRAISFHFFVVAVLASVVSATLAFAVDRKEAEAVVPEGTYTVKDGRRVHALPKKHANVKKAPKSKIAHLKKGASKKGASKKVASSSAKKSARPSRKIANKSAHLLPKTKTKVKTARHSEKHPVKRMRTAQHPAKSSPSHPRSRLPVARETHNERDMPFVSIPHRRVGSADRTIVMDDPAIKSPLPKPGRAQAALKPDSTVLDPASESPPSAVGAAKAAQSPPAEPTIVGPAPASVSEPVVEAPIAAPVSPGREPDAFDLHSGQDPMRGP